MSISEVIVLYDIPTNDPKPKIWSPNTVKARFALNYKGIPFKTEWIEYPDIEALCLKLNVPATSKKADGRPHYTLPIIYDPSTKRALADSAAIAKYLDVTYPSTPVLFPPGTDALQHVFLDSWFSTVGRPLYMSTIAQFWTVLTPRSAEYYRRTNEVTFGNKLEALGTAAEWKQLEEELGKVDRWMSANGPGKDELLLGDRICFGDFQIAAALYCARFILGADSQNWKEMAAWHNGKWKRIVEAFEIYAVVDA